MSIWLFVALSVAGGLGAACRYLLDSAMKPRFRGAFPWSTVLINASGSLALGFLTGAAGHGLLPQGLSVVLGAGFLGGYTTFSTASYETVRLVQDGKRAAALANALGTLVVCAAFASAGLWIAGMH